MENNDFGPRLRKWMVAVLPQIGFTVLVNRPLGCGLGLHMV